MSDINNISGVAGAHFVTRTATGLPHGNTLALHRMWTVIVHIDKRVYSQGGQGSGNLPDGSQGQSGGTDDGPAPESQASSGSSDSANQANAGQGQPQKDPSAAQNGWEAQDSWRLVNDDDGIYDKTLQRSDAVRMDDKLLTVRFTQVIPQGTYSLYHCLPSGTQLPVFLSVPFANLEEHGEETPEPSYEDWTLPDLEPEPAPASNDPHLLYDPVDVTLAPPSYSDYAWYGSDALPDDPQGDSQPDSQDESDNEPASTDNSQPNSQADDSSAAPDPGQDSAAA